MGKRILFLANHFITLYSFRKEMISRMLDEGNEVILSLPPNEDNRYFEDLGCRIELTPIDRRGVNPLKDVKLIFFYKKLLRKVNPDVVFSFTIKPNVYGAFACNSSGYRQICNITGTGATFLNNNFLSVLCRVLYRSSIKKSYKVFFQNSGDRDYFLAHKMINKHNFAMLPGSGCNLEQHSFSPMPEIDEISFIYVGRVMKLKGIDEYLICANRIKNKYPRTRFYIAGWNEESEYMKKVEEAQKEGYVEYLGFRKDIDSCIAKCHCTILASYGGEGVPNVLLESAAIGRICVASRINGSIDVVEDGVTGFLFEPHNASDLISKVEKVLMMTSKERMEMGLAGRRKVEREFNREIVIQAYLQEVMEA